MRNGIGGALITSEFEEGALVGSAAWVFFRDQLGSVRQAHRRDTGQVATLDYGPYGEPTGTAGGYVPLQGYAGMSRLGEGGLYVTRYRMYDPGLGRWLSRDPIGTQGGPNVYAFVSGKALSKIDPFGLVEWSGSFDAKGLVGPVGGVKIVLDLTSDCVDERQVNVEVTVVMGAAGVGAVLTQVKGDIVLTDHADGIDTSRLEGSAGMLSVGVQVGALGSGYTKIRIGDAFSRELSDARGFDASATAAMGSATITGGRGEIACECQ